MTRPLLVAGLAVLILGSASAAHAHGDTRGDYRSSQRGGCDSRAPYGGSSYWGRQDRDGYRYGRADYGTRGGRGRYGAAEYGPRGGRSRDGRRDHRDWRDRADTWDDDRYDRYGR